MMTPGTTSRQKRGLRQGDPLSPILFNIVADMLTILIEREKSDGQIEGVVPHLVDGVFLYFNMQMMRFFLWNTI